jgi:hypothetical protein
MDYLLIADHTFLSGWKFIELDSDTDWMADFISGATESVYVQVSPLMHVFNINYYPVVTTDNGVAPFPFV